MAVCPTHRASTSILLLVVVVAGCSDALLYTESDDSGDITLFDSTIRDGGSPRDSGPAADTGVADSGGTSDSSTPDTAPQDTGATLGLADGVTITGLAAFQTVKVDLVRGGAIATPNAPVIAGREIRFRAYVSGSSAGNISAFLSVTNGGTTNEFMDTGRVSGVSDDGNPGSLFEFDVPASQITPTTQLAVALMENGGSGANTARFPRDGSSFPLGARTNGGLDVVIVPIQYGADGSGRLPDTGAAAMDALRAHVRALFPVADVNLRVRAPSAYNGQVTRTGFSQWAQALNHVLALRQADRAPNHEYYLGVINPGSSFSSYCGGGCVAGIAPLNTSNSASQRGGLALGYAQENSRFAGIHEFGHAFGVSHAPCGGAADPDRAYPYSGGTIGVWGFDVRSNTFFPPNTNDMMGYCDPKWLSDYNFQKLHQRILAVSGSGSADFHEAPMAPHHLVGVAPFAAPNWVAQVDDFPAAESDDDVRVYQAEDELGRPLGPVLVREVPLSMPGTLNLLIPVVDGVHHYTSPDGTTYTLPSDTR